MSSDRFAIGVDIGGTNIRAARISADGHIAQRYAVASSRDPAAALDIIGKLIAELDNHNVHAIGIGVPGRVNAWTGQVLSGGFVDLSQVDLKEDLARRFARPVTVANDCSMALVAEAKCGAAAGRNNVLMLTIGTGIGGAALQGGKLVNGKRCGGQFGHVVVKVGGRPCLCGQHGCIETESSGTALGRHMSEAGFADGTRFEDIMLRASSGDEAASSVLSRWAEPLKAAINTLSAAFDPDLVLLGGGMGGAALQALRFLPPTQSWYSVDIAAASLGDDAGVIGAGLAALEATKVSSPRSTPGAKRLVMVNGVPASGKSSLSRALSENTGWPVLALDTIKNPFLEVIENVDRPFNRVLGKAAYKAIFSVIAEAPPGSTFIVDAWFGFQPVELLQSHLAMADVGEVVELWCHAPPEVVAERYSRRIGLRPPGHPGLSYVPELVELVKRAGPVGLGPVFDIETTVDHDISLVVRNIEASFAVGPVT